MDGGGSKNEIFLSNIFQNMSNYNDGSFLFCTKISEYKLTQKFIAVMAKDLNISNGITTQDILLLFDQHAVHERIRLEKLITGKLILWIYLIRPKLHH